MRNNLSLSNAKFWNNDDGLWRQINELVVFTGIALCAEHLPNVVAVLRPLQTPDSPNPIVVDVVCDGGRTWVKVITKNTKALLANVNGNIHDYSVIVIIALFIIWGSSVWNLSFS